MVLHPIMKQSEGMDECDTIALAYQCGQEKAPELVANAISSVELNSTLVKKH
jgi:type III secretion system FlhB-like substrate exporter